MDNFYDEALAKAKNLGLLEEEETVDLFASLPQHLYPKYIQLLFEAERGHMATNGPKGAFEVVIRYIILLEQRIEQLEGKANIDDAMGGLW